MEPPRKELFSRTLRTADWTHPSLNHRFPSEPEPRIGRPPNQRFGLGWKPEIRTRMAASDSDSDGSCPCAVALQCRSSVAAEDRSTQPPRGDRAARSLSRPTAQTTSWSQFAQSVIRTRTELRYRRLGVAAQATRSCGTSDSELRHSRLHGAVTAGTAAITAQQQPSRRNSSRHNSSPPATAVTGESATRSVTAPVAP